MTRINTIDPYKLSNKHLLAEYRELPRVFQLARNASERGESPNDKRNPLQYTMGTGHVRFFYNKLQYLLERQLQIVAECSSRGFKITHKNPEILLEGIPDCWKNSWRPSKGDKLTNLARLKKRDKEFYQNFIEFL